MEAISEFKVVEKYEPNTKFGNIGPNIRMHRSGHISLNEKAQLRWVGEAKRVDLYFLADSKGNAIGIKPIKDSSSGLSLVTNKKWKSKYISARGFFSKHKIPFVSKELFSDYDEKLQMIVARLDSAVGSIRNSESGHSQVKSENKMKELQQSLETQDILELFANGKSIWFPDILDFIRKKRGLKFRANSLPKRKFRSEIYHRLSKFVQSGQLQVVDTRPRRGGSTKCYKANNI